MLLFIHIKEEEKELYMKWGNGVNCDNGGVSNLNRDVLNYVCNVVMSRLLMFIHLVN
jgi:hypothetical protein